MKTDNIVWALAGKLLLRMQDDDGELEASNVAAFVLDICEELDVDIDAVIQRLLEDT